MIDKRTLAALTLAFAAGLPRPALAGPGHDHDQGHAAPGATGPALPRFAASSELFDLVGVVNGKQVTLYLDRAADNAPVMGAQIELEIGGTKYRPEARDDVYQLTLPGAPPPGVLPVTATVNAGNDIDLLAADLDIPAETDATETAHEHGGQEYLPWAAGGIAALIALVVIGRRRAGGRQARTGAPA